jgi:hypothetical protein
VKVSGLAKFIQTNANMIKTELKQMQRSGINELDGKHVQVRQIRQV